MESDKVSSKRIYSGFAGSGGGAADEMALIGLLVTDAGRRLRILSGIGMGIFAAGIPMAIILPSAVGARDGVSAVMTGLCVTLFVLSALVFAIARKSDTSARSLVHFGLGYVVVTAMAMAVAETILAVDRTPAWTGVSGICIWIVLFPLIMPSQPRQALITALVSASMLPISYGVQRLLGGPVMPAAVLVKWWTPVYFCAGLSFASASLIQGLTRALAKAQGDVRRAGGYEVGEKIAEGGMGQVWRARHSMLPHDVAVKVIRPLAASNVRPTEVETLVRRFRLEAQAVAVLRSPNTVRLFDYGVTDDGELYAVMEFLPGIDLQRMVEDHGVLPPGRVIHILDQICLSLAEAHGKGLVHRDIKPANVMACHMGFQSDIVKVLDFGLVGAIREASDVLGGMDGESTVMGTPGFIAPEVLLGEAGDERSDLFAVGVVAYWLLTGTTLFPLPGGGEDLAKHLSEPVILPSERRGSPVPADLESLVMRCLDRDPADRPVSAPALRAELHFCGGVEEWSEADAERWWLRHMGVGSDTLSTLESKRR